MVTARLVLLALLVLVANPLAAYAQNVTTPVTVTVIGSGSMGADPNRGGPALLLNVRQVGFLFDAGANVVRNMAAAGQFAGLVQAAFLTQLDLPQVLGLADFMLTPWVVGGRITSFSVYGPPGKLNASSGTTNLVNQIAMPPSSASAIGAQSGAYTEDINARIAWGARGQPYYWAPNAIEIDQGPVDALPPSEGSRIYASYGIKVAAFRAYHNANTLYAMGYTVVYNANDVAHKIVIAGDTAPTANVAAACDGCDVLIYGVYQTTDPSQESQAWRAAHTSALELGPIAQAAHPQVLVLTQIVDHTQSAHLDADLCAAVAHGYAGQPGFTGYTIAAHDGDQVVVGSSKQNVAYTCPQP